MGFTAKEHIASYDELKALRGTWEAHWQELSEFMYPQRSDFVGKLTAGDKRRERIFDSTAVVTNELLASGLHGMLTNPASEWFLLTVNDQTFASDHEAKMWLAAVTDIMLAEMGRSEAMFSSAMHEFYMEYSAFATGIMSVMENDKRDGLFFAARALSENVLIGGKEGVVDGDYRKFEYTVRQTIQEWGDNVSDSVKKLQKAGKVNDKIEILHVIQPRSDFDPFKKDRLNKEISSIYIEVEAAHVLDEGGFDEMPIMAARFSKTSNELYGRGPGTSALADVKMLNEMMKTTIKAAQKVVDPPLLVVGGDSAIGPIKAIPSGVNYVRRGGDIRALSTGGDIRLGEELMESVRSRIRAAFFIDQLQLGQGPQMTATEVIQRTEEKLRLLGPALGRLQAELLGPMIDRAFGILFRMGKFPPLPPRLIGMPIDVEYTSPIARAQKTLDIQSIPRLLEVMGPFIQGDPSILDRFDADAAFASVGDTLGVDPRFMRSDQEVAKLQKQRQEAEQAQAELEAAQQGASAIKDLSAV